MSVSVAIFSHNYGRYLPQCVHSVLDQSLEPVEIVIVDDSSTDDTPEIGRAFGAFGVEYRRVSTGSIWRNRLDAIQTLTGKWVVCMDADNLMPPDYLQAAVAIGDSDPRCGIVYPSLQRFGHDTTLVDFSLPKAPVSVANYIDAAAVYRREAILQTDLTGIRPKLFETAEDWILARRVLTAGWSARHNPEPLGYRVHASNKSNHDKQKTYFNDAGLEFEPVTIIVPLSGRKDLWPQLVDWFNWQTWPANQCRIVLIDNSHDPAFEQTVKQWVANCDYPDVRYCRSNAGRAGLADEPRTGHREHDKEVHRTVAAIYNLAFSEASTDYVLTLEDDIEPPPDAVERLFRAMRPDFAAVSAAYLHRNGKHWLSWHRDTPETFQSRRGSGVELIGGSGFGCLLIRRLVAQSLRLTTDGVSPFYDRNAFVEIGKQGWRVAVNWDVVCEHQAEEL